MSTADIFDFDENAPDRAPALPGSAFDDDVPPAGTPCAGCKSLGHWCPAKCYRGESTALCIPCANGVDCQVVVAKLNAAQGWESDEFVLERFDRPPAPCRSISVASGLAVQTAPVANVARLPYTPDPEALRMPKQEIKRERYARPLPQLPPVRIVGKPKEIPDPEAEAAREIVPVRAPELEKSEGVKAMPQFNEITDAVKEQIRNAPA